MNLEAAVVANCLGNLLSALILLLGYLLFELWRDYIAIICSAFLLSQALARVTRKAVRALKAARRPSSPPLLRQLVGFAAEEARLREEATRLEEEEEMLDTTALTAAALGALQVDRCRATLASAWQQLTAIFHRRTLCRSLDLPLYVTPSSPPSPCAHCAAAPAILHQGTTVPLAEDPNIYGSILGVLASPEHTESNVSFSLQEPATSPTAGGPLKMMSTRSFPVRMISVKCGRVACKSLAL